jgi:hypothetical protein
LKEVLYSGRFDSTNLQEIEGHKKGTGKESLGVKREKTYSHYSSGDWKISVKDVLGGKTGLEAG